VVLEAGERVVRGQRLRELRGQIPGCACNHRFRAGLGVRLQDIRRICIELVWRGQARSKAALALARTEIDRDDLKLTVLGVLACAQFDHFAQPVVELRKEDLVAYRKLLLGLINCTARKLRPQLGVFATDALSHKVPGHLVGSQWPFSVQQEGAQELDIGRGE